jgi:diaminopimelate epimerase
VRFSKYSGAGNDFVITVAEWSEDQASAVARVVCPRSTGVGVDGLIVLRRAGRDRLGVQFVNPDGSVFATCGNGSRCAARFALDQGLVEGPTVTLETPSGEVEASVQGGLVELSYRICVSVQGSYSVDGPEGEASGWLVQIGLPHFVLPVKQQPTAAIEQICGPIRHLEAFGREGANVNLVRLADRRSGSIRTFERGVEGETLACGSGAMASAFALHSAGLCGPSLELQVRGGDTLRVTVGDEVAGSGGLREVGLGGPAVRVFDGIFPEPPPGS